MSPTMHSRFAVSIDFVQRTGDQENPPHKVTLSDSLRMTEISDVHSNKVTALQLSDAFGSNMTTDSKASSKVPIAITNVLSNMQNTRNTGMSAMTAMTATTAITALSGMTPTAHESRYV